MRFSLLEVIACSVTDAIEAEKGGAHRLEVVRDLQRGGLTPSYELVQQISRAVAIPIRVMLRANERHELHDEDEIESLCGAAERFASLEIDKSMVPYDATATCLIERMRRVASWYPFKTIAMIFEASDRGDMFAARFFPNFTFAVDGSNVPIEYRRAGKSLCEPGLEVADFIMHTAGAQVRDQMIGKVDGTRRFRKDFESVFHSVDKRQAEYLLIDSVMVTKAGA